MLDDVQCTGSENKLLACSSTLILDVSSNCDHSDDAGVRCEGILYVCTIKMKSVHCVLESDIVSMYVNLIIIQALVRGREEKHRNRYH